jgi:hypothetical protein
MAASWRVRTLLAVACAALVLSGVRLFANVPPLASVNQQGYAGGCSAGHDTIGAPLFFTWSRTVAVKADSMQLIPVPHYPLPLLRGVDRPPASGGVIRTAFLDAWITRTQPIKAAPRGADTYLLMLRTRGRDGTIAASDGLQLGSTANRMSYSLTIHTGAVLVHSSRTVTCNAAFATAGSVFDALHS